MKSRNLLPAFTLVELLVVIAIIGVLAGVLLSTFSGGSESARSARCLTNMKNLANACQTYAMKTSRYPTAGGREVMSVSTSDGRRKAKTVYTENPGWISWDSKGKYDENGQSQSACNPATIGLYSDDTEKSIHALTNGCLWKYVAENRETYVCPSHVKKNKNSTRPLWSYLMNGYFGWTKSGDSACTSDDNVIWYNGLSRADRRLLFAEIPFMSYSSWQPEGSSGSEETDAILQYATSDLSNSEKPDNPGNETIGANHVQGKNLLAHVVFADGHVEKLRIPYSGTIKSPKADDSMLQKLTSWLCAGKDVSFDGSQYQKMTSN